MKIVRGNEIDTGMSVSPVQASIYRFQLDYASLTRVRVYIARFSSINTIYLASLPLVAIYVILGGK